MLKELFKTEKEVEKILEELPITRKDDNLLYIEYWRRKATDVSFIDFFAKPRKYGGKAYKSVERCRRKIQEKRPELKDAETAAARLEETMKYENYAING